MAKLEAKRYFQDIETQYFEIKGILEDITEYYNKGEMTEEQVKDALADFERAQLVYDTARIFMDKLNKPSSRAKKKREPELVEIPKEFDNYLEGDKN